MIPLASQKEYKPTSHLFRDTPATARKRVMPSTSGAGDIMLLSSGVMSGRTDASLLTLLLGPPRKR